MHSFIANAIYVHNTGTLDAIDVCSLVITPLYLRYQGATNCQVIASVGQWVLRAEMLSSVRPSHRNRHNSLGNHHGNCQQNQKIHPQQKRVRYNMREVVKKRIIYRQADCKFWPPLPPIRSGQVFFWCAFNAYSQPDCKISPFLWLP